jgi:hypothetical protein
MVPETPSKVTDSFHDGQLAMGVLMQGLPVALKTGMNHIEYVEAILSGMGQVIQQIEQRGGMATMQEFIGLNNVASHISQHIALIAQDPNEKQRIKQYGDAMSQMMNMVRAYGQRLQQAQQAQQAGQGGNGQPDPKDAAKAQVMVVQAQQKAQAQSESHAQRTAQRQVQFEQEQQRKTEQHQADLAMQAQKTQAEIEQQAAKNQAELEAQASKNKLDIQQQVVQGMVDLKDQAVRTGAEIENDKRKSEAKPKPQ